MAICNIFKELSGSNGIFLTFSQYLEDITKQQTLSDKYRVVPSRFVAVDIDPKEMGLTNKNIPQIIQNYYENACSCWRDKLKNDWKPSHSKDLFWSMFVSKFVTRKPIEIDQDSQDEENLHQAEELSSIIPNIKYLGDINIYSYDEKDGMGYSEIYCHIPNEASVEDIKITPEGIVQVLSTDEVGSHIKGYTAEELQTAGLPLDWGKIEFDEQQLSSGTLYPLQQHNISEGSFTGEVPSSFNINSLIILYNVYDSSQEGTHNILYQDIPMGIYFTGTVDEINGVFHNPITKYISNDSIYGSGTSYGIRICSKYVTTVDNVSIKEMESSDDYHAEMTQVLSQVSASLSKMDQILDNVNSNNQNYKDVLSIFKNDRTNVPYIKQIGEDEYWCVNGRPISQVKYIVLELSDKDKEEVKAIAEAKIEEVLDNFEHNYLSRGNFVPDVSISSIIDSMDLQAIYCPPV